MTMHLSTSFMRWILFSHVRYAALLVILLAPLSLPTVAQDPSNPHVVAPVEKSTLSTATQPDRTTQAEQDLARSGSLLRLEAGDLVEVNVYNVPELTTKARISSAGEVYLPLIESVHVAGLTAEEAEGLIQKRLSDGGFVKSPHVTLFVDQFASQGASVLGEVSRPGVYPVLGEQRLFDLVSVAGGFTEKAGRGITITHRSQTEKPITVPLSRNVADNPESNIPIFPGDTIIVHKADLVYVVGDVGRPSGFLMDRGRLTVLQALALAGGTTRTANLGGARILRTGPDGTTETPVQLKKILNAKAPDLILQADDILFVPTSTAKAITGRTLEAAMQAATAASVIAVP
jgi:polysaccharide biosynthesis/export protein